ncbi:MAG: NYN domain-containing protein [Candidatus Omnitrophota bacterium]
MNDKFYAKIETSGKLFWALAGGVRLLTKVKEVKMQQLILDGYNVIHKIPQLAAHLSVSLESARKSLANFMLTWKRTHAYRGEICIVFDGRDGILNSGEALCGIKCIYTKTKQDADDRIISIVRNSKNSAAIRVISNDNYVTNNCKAHGAAVKAVQFMLEPPKSKTEQTNKEIDPAAAKDINDFLKKEWGL